MNPIIITTLITLFVSAFASEIRYTPRLVFNVTEHDILNVRYLMEISSRRFHTEAAVDRTSDGMIITTIDPEALSNTLRSIIAAGESDFEHLKEAILSSNEAIISLAVSQKYLSTILKESVESLSSAIDYSDRLRAYRTEMLPVLASHLIEEAKVDLYKRRNDEPVNTVLMDIVYDLYRQTEGYRMTTCSAVFDKTILKGSVSRFRHRIDCVEQPPLDVPTIISYIDRGTCFETVTEEVYVTQDVYGDHSKELPIGYVEDESFINMYIRPSEIVNFNSTFAMECIEVATSILGNYYSHHLLAKRSDLLECHSVPYVFPSRSSDVSNCRSASVGVGSFLNLGFSSMRFKDLINYMSKPRPDSSRVINIRSNFSIDLGSQRSVKVVGPPPCSRSCCSGEYSRHFQDFSGVETLFETSYTGLWYSQDGELDSFNSITNFMKTDLPKPFEASSEGVSYYKTNSRLYLSKVVKTLIPKPDEGFMTCFNGELSLTNFTGRRVPLVKVPTQISYCKSNSKIITPSIKEVDGIYTIEESARGYGISESCPPDDDTCEFYASFDCDLSGRCQATNSARMYTSESSRCNNVVRISCVNTTKCDSVPDAEYVLLDEETLELCSIKYNSTSVTITNYEIQINETEHIDQKIEELVNNQIKTVEDSLDRTIVDVREASEKLKSYDSAFKNITIELNLSFYRVGEEIGKVKAIALENQREIKALKVRMDVAEENIKTLDKKIDHVNDRLDKGDFKHNDDIDIAKGFESLGEGALDLIRDVIKLPFQAGGFFDYVIKAVCYVALILFGLFIIYCLFQIIRCLLPIVKSMSHERNLSNIRERVVKRSEKIATIPEESRKEKIPMFGTLTRRRTQDELEMHELSRSSIYFTEDPTVTGKPDKKFSIVEIENLPTIKLLKLCNLVKKVTSSDGEYYLIRKSAPSEKPSALRHYDLDSDACKYIVYAYKFGGFRIHF